jgi:hypothetical protein
MISTVINTIISELKAAGINALDAPGSEYLADNSSASRFTGVYETDCDYTVTDTSTVVSARYTIRLDVFASGKTATTWARSDVETAIVVLANIPLDLNVTGWTRGEEDTFTRASYTISCDVHETIEFA